MYSDGVEWVEIHQSGPTAFSRRMQGGGLGGPGSGTDAYVGIGEFYGLQSARVAQSDYEVMVEARDREFVLSVLSELKLAIPR